MTLMECTESEKHFQVEGQKKTKKQSNKFSFPIKMIAKLEGHKVLYNKTKIMH